jgi:hypothetical protein
MDNEIYSEIDRFRLAASEHLASMRECMHRGDVDGAIHHNDMVEYHLSMTRQLETVEACRTNG